MKSNNEVTAAAYNSVKTTEVFTEEEDDNEKKTYDRTKLFNIFLIGLVFMTTGSRTPISIQKTVVYSATQPNTSTYIEDYQGDGYLSNSLLYASFATSNFIAPWVIDMIGPRLSMFVGGFGYTCYSAQMLYLSDWLLYSSAVANGVGASLLWTGQGNFLSINTSPGRSARDSGIFWSLYQLSGVLGNIAVYFLFQGVTIIEDDVRIKTAATFTALSLLGQLITLMFRPTPWYQPSRHNLTNPLKSFISCLQLLRTPDMIKLSLMFLYTGLEISFWAGVLPSCVGFTVLLGDTRKSVMGLASVMVSVGSMTGGLLLITCKNMVSRVGRVPVILFGIVCHMSAYVMCGLVLPHMSPLGDTDQVPLVTPSLWSLLTLSLLMGLGDAAFNTQVISLVSSQYKDNSSQAFALVKLVQSVGVSAGFAVSSVIGLHWQLVVLVTSALTGSLGFFLVERRSKNKEITS